jgi:FG-GAP-like repeat
LVSADFNVSLFVQTSPGTFAAPISLYPAGANWVALGDLNGDGATDVALTDNVGVKVLLHTGAPTSTTFAAPLTVFTQSPNFNVVGGNIIAIADVDGDGLNDLVITDPGPTGGMSPAVYVLLQNPANHGSFLAAVGYPIATQDLAQSIVVKDLQGSGKLDIVIGGRKSVTVLLHDPANPGKFLPATIYPAAGANEIAVADINGDGKPDIVVSNGMTFPMQGGVSTTHPGVLLQSAATPGAFGPLQDLP